MGLSEAFSIDSSSFLVMNNLKILQFNCIFSIYLSESLVMNQSISFGMLPFITCKENKPDVTVLGTRYVLMN